MTATITTLESSDSLNVMGETLRPLLTTAMGSAIEIFDTSGPGRLRPGTAPPPVGRGLRGTRRAARGQRRRRQPDTRARRVAHIPAGTTHSYRNLTDDTRFLTVTTAGNAARFFTQVSSQVVTNPPDIPAIVHIAATHGIAFAG